MKLDKKIFNWQNASSLILFAALFNIWSVFLYPDPVIIIEPKIIEREVKVSDCACIPCDDEPPLPKCSFQSVAYQAISDQFDPITGWKLLEKGDKYYFVGDEFYSDYIRFCSLNPDFKDEYMSTEPKYNINDCFYTDQILNKKLFKSIK